MFYKFFCKFVTPSMGANSHGKCGYFKLPFHKLLCHTAADMDWLWKFKVLMGQVITSPT
jgi:hypothetical protein